jgi:phospholipid/cholesterol/gamma-HCH transport system substrate-binding protein
MRKKEYISIHEFRVGIFVTFAVVALTAVIVMMSGKFGFFSRTIHIEAEFDNVGGLIEGAPVFFSGVEVGKVEKVYLLPDGNVKVKMKILEREAVKIPADTVATLRTMGVLGDVVVELQKGVSLKSIKDGALITGTPMKTIPQAFEVFGILAQKMADAVDSLKVIATTISEGKGSLGKFINDPSLYNKLLSTISLLESSAKDVQSVTNDIKNAVSKFYPEKSAEDLRKTLDNLEKITKRLDEFSKNLESKDGTLPKLLTDDRMYKELLSAINELKELIADIKKNPKKYMNIKIF